MSRPQVSLENFEAVYDYYESHKQNQVFAMFGHAVLSRVYKPTISFAEDGAAKEAISQEFSAGTRLVISPNHLTEDDQYVIVSVVQREEVLHPLRGHTFIPSKPSLFTRPLRQGGPILRRMIDGLGAIPIVRLEDLDRQGIVITPEIEELHRKAMLRADEIQVSKLVEQGNHMAGFWEGTRNREDHTKVQRLKKGIGYTVCKAAEDVDVSIVPVGVCYGGKPTDYKKLAVPHKYTPHVHIHIGMPFRVETTSPEELVQVVHPAIQGCVDVAVNASMVRAAS
jgi:1-acyl-sn-glycerol-3-phosphate acyltransferase